MSFVDSKASMPSCWSAVLTLVCALLDCMDQGGNEKGWQLQHVQIWHHELFDMACALVHVQLCTLIVLGHARWLPGLESFCHTCLIIIITLIKYGIIPLDLLTVINSICPQKEKSFDLFSQATKQLGIYWSFIAADMIWKTSWLLY